MCPCFEQVSEQGIVMYGTSLAIKVFASFHFHDIFKLWVEGRISTTPFLQISAKRHLSWEFERHLPGRLQDAFEMHCGTCVFGFICLLWVLHLNESATLNCWRTFLMVLVLNSCLLSIYCRFCQLYMLLKATDTITFTLQLLKRGGIKSLCLYFIILHEWWSISWNKYGVGGKPAAIFFKFLKQNYYPSF